VTSNSTTTTSIAQARVLAAIQRLAAVDGELANVLAKLTAVVAEEAIQNAGFGARLTEVLIVDRRHNKAVVPHETSTTAVVPASSRVSAKARPKRVRRAAGPWDPYNVYAESGEAGLRERLSRLELEQLRDIIAEHGMNTDGLAMRWTKADRVVGRIVDRVVDRSAKGDAFRRA
jgi:hypothetical protein